jgi:ABC-type glutathione transport system ATPase component
MSAALKMETPAPLVRVRDLNVTFMTRDRTVHAVNGMDMDLAAGEVLCILGESGSGKSVTLRALLRLLPKFARVSGSILLPRRSLLVLRPNCDEELQEEKIVLRGIPAPVSLTGSSRARRSTCARVRR